MKLARWVIYLTVSRIMDLLAIVLITIYMPYFWFKVRKKGAWSEVPSSYPDKVHDLDEIIAKAYKDPLRDTYFLDHNDAHTALIHSSLWLLQPGLAEKGLELLLTPENSLYRRCPNDEAHLSPSGDGLSSWVFAYLVADLKRPDLVERLVKHYMKNCFALSWYGRIDARSSNAGFNVIDGGWPTNKPKWPFKWGFSQPNAGPQYFTTAAILALAATEIEGYWPILYKMHYWLGFGWFWELFPIQYFGGNERQWYYSHHISQLNLWSLSVLRGGKKWPLKYIAEWVTPTANPWIAGMANSRKALSKAKQDEAIKVLERTLAVWPQGYVNDQYFLNNKDFQGLYSSMALASIFLKKQ